MVSPTAIAGGDDSPRDGRGKSAAEAVSMSSAITSERVILRIAPQTVRTH